MGYRSFDVNVVSATGLKNATNKDVYVVVSVKEFENYKAGIHKNGGSDPKWDHWLRFNVFESQTVVIKIKAVRTMFFDKKLGEVKVPIKELVKGVTSEGNKDMQSVRYDLEDKKGVIGFWYQFGELIVKKKHGSSSCSGDGLFAANLAASASMSMSMMM